MARGLRLLLTLAGAALAGVALAGVARAQAPSAAPPALTIIVEVLAEDARGRPLSALGPRDVELRQEGVVQAAVEFQALPTPGRHEIRYVPSSGRPGPLTLRPLRAGLTIGAPDGQLLRPRVVSGPSPLEVELGALLDARPDAAAIRARAAALRFHRGPAGTRVAAIIETPMDDLRLQADGGLPSAHVQFLARVKDESGRELARVSGDRSVVAGASLSAQRLVWTGVLQVPAGRHVLETVVRDVASSNAGVQRVPFEVAAATTGLALSSVVLLRPSGGVQLTDAHEAEDPLFFRGVALMPSLRPSLPLHAATVVQFFAAVYPDPALAVPAKLRAEVLRAGRVVGGVDLQLPAPDARGAQPYLGQLATRTFAPAEYTLRLIATQGEARASSEATFEMVARTPGEPPAASR